MEFSNSLIQWYLQNKRDLPWRNTTNPYWIWLSEIMLQQTRVAQGLPYFLAFTEAFPTVFDLANANEEQVLKLWQGLGYYSRARNLHATAKYIANELNEIYLEEGLLQYRTFGYGHSFGVLSHYYGREAGLELREDIDTVIEPGMVISMEPMLMLPQGMAGAGGYREHDILVVTESGTENITKFPYGPEHNIIKA